MELRITFVLVRYSSWDEKNNNFTEFPKIIPETYTIKVMSSPCPPLIHLWKERSNRL